MERELGFNRRDFIKLASAGAGLALPFVIQNTISISKAEAQTLCPRPLPRITIQTVRGVKRFENSQTGEEFTPLGYNFTRFHPSPYRDKVSRFVTFEPGYYDRSVVERMLEQLESYKFNTVRVFINEGRRCTEQILGIAGPRDQPDGLYEPYMQNFLDFLKLARDHCVYVIPVLSFVPQNDYFMLRVDPRPPSCDATPTHAVTGPIEGENRYYLFAPALQAKAEYMHKFVRRVAAEEGGNLLTTILSYELQNEMVFFPDAPPFNGVQPVTTADGQTYNMNIPKERQQCANANAVHWANTQVAAVRHEDPEALISVSMYTMYLGGRARPDYVAFQSPNQRPYPALPTPFAAFSNLSYVSVHLYPTGNGYTAQYDLSTSDYPDWLDRMPAIMGEFGALRGNPPVYPTAQSAGVPMRKHRDDVCALGFSGALYWTWDDPTDNVWAAVEENGAINYQLIPAGQCKLQ